MARHPICHTCRWYDHNANYAENAGLCRVNPPQMTGVIAPHGNSQFQYPQDAMWPITTREEWCGKHEIIEGGE